MAQAQKPRMLFLTGNARDSHGDLVGLLSRKCDVTVLEKVGPGDAMSEIAAKGPFALVVMHHSLGTATHAVAMKIGEETALPICEIRENKQQQPRVPTRYRRDLINENEGKIASTILQKVA